LADAKELLEESIASLEELVRRGELAGGDEEFKEVLGRLSSAVADLKPTLGKVFLKTKQGLSFAIPVHDAVEDIVASLGAAVDKGDPASALADVQDALDTLESNVNTLRAKVASRDTVMT